jgi:hypothetical protein
MSAVCLSPLPPASIGSGVEVIQPAGELTFIPSMVSATFCMLLRHARLPGHAPAATLPSVWGFLSSETQVTARAVSTICLPTFSHCTLWPTLALHPQKCGQPRRGGGRGGIAFPPATSKKSCREGDRADTPWHQRQSRTPPDSRG